MATVSMDHVQFYQPPFIKPLVGSKHVASPHIDPKHLAAPRHKNRSQVLLDGWADFGSQCDSSRDQDAVSEDDLPTVKELLCPTLRKEISIEDLENPEHALQTANQRSPWGNGGYITTAHSRSVNLGDSQENPVFIDNDKLDNTYTEAASTYSNADSAGQQVDLCPSPVTYSSLGNDLGGTDSLEDYYIKEILCSALVNQDIAIPACPYETSLQPPSESLQEVVSQDDVSCPISHDASRELSQPPLDISDKDNERAKQHQHQEAKQEEQEKHNYNSSGNGDSDDNHGQDGDDSEGPRPAKRLRLSRSLRDCASKRICKRRLRRPRSSRSTTVKAQPECASLRFQESICSSSTDEEPTSHTGAEYQEWPMHGFLKRTTIGDEIRYSMEFSLEQLYELCALAGPRHTSQASSATGYALLPTQARKSRLGPFSRIKGTRFTQEEDARLINMKEIKCLSWDEIEGAFPGRTRATLQVRYSTRLKRRASSSGKQQLVTPR